MREIQFRLGLLIEAIAAIGIVLNCIILATKDGSEKAIPNFILILTAATILGIVSFIDKRICRILQASFFLAFSCFIIYVEGYDSFPGMAAYVIGIMLVNRYEKKVLSNKFFLALLCILPVLTSVLHYANSFPGGILKSISAGCFIFIFCLMLYFIFEKGLIKATQEVQSKESTIQSLIPTAKIGEQTAAILHSTKNNLSSINMTIELMKLKGEAIDIDQVISLIQQINQHNMDILYLAKEDPVKSRIDINHLLQSMMSLYKTMPQFKSGAEMVYMQSGDTLFIEGYKASLLLMFENIYQNAIQAIAETGQYGKITTNITSTSLSIKNSGGAIPMCSNCSKQCLSNCPYFLKIGTSTKKDGTGRGMNQIFTAAKELGWNLQVRTDTDSTELLFTFC